MSERVGTDYWSKHTGNLFDGCEPYKDFYGNTVIENDIYKVKIGKFVNGLFSITSFCPCYKGYKKVDGKWVYVCTYYMSSIENMNRFLHQMEYEYDKPSRKWNIKKRLDNIKTDL